MTWPLQQGTEDVRGNAARGRLLEDQSADPRFLGRDLSGGRGLRGGVRLRAAAEGSPALWQLVDWWQLGPKPPGSLAAAAPVCDWLVIVDAQSGKYLISYAGPPSK